MVGFLRCGMEAAPYNIMIMVYLGFRTPLNIDFKSAKKHDINYNYTTYLPKMQDYSKKFIDFIKILWYT